MTGPEILKDVVLTRAMGGGLEEFEQVAAAKISEHETLAISGIQVEIAALKGPEGLSPLKQAFEAAVNDTVGIAPQTPKVEMQNNTALTGPGGM